MAEYNIPSEDDYERASLAEIETMQQVDYHDLPPQGSNESINAYRERLGLPGQWKGRINRAEVSGMVDKWYEMDPETEDLLYNGTELEVGMIVLLESPHLKVDVGTELTDEELYHAHRNNRWFMVARLEFADNETHILAEYEDGSKAKLCFETGQSWLVKIPRPTVAVFETPGKGYFVDPDTTVIGRASVVETPRGLEVQVDETAGRMAADEALDIVTNGGEKPKTVFEEAEARWLQEKGTPFPGSPFSTS